MLVGDCVRLRLVVPAALVLIALTIIAPSLAVAQDAASSPAPVAEATTKPAPGGDESGAITRAATLEEALKFGEDEKTILAAVRDRDGQIDAAALYVLLRRAAMLPTGKDFSADAERPTFRNVLKEPARYRGRLVYMKGLYFRTTNLTPETTRTRRWGDRPVYVVDMVDAETQEDILVVLTGEPPKFNDRQPIQVSGLFYKVVTRQENSKSGHEGRTHEYPIIVADEVQPVLNTVQAWAPPGAWWLVPALAIVVVFIILYGRNMRLRKEHTQKAKERRDRIRQLRQAELEDAGPVDPELLRQLQEARREQEGQGPPKDSVK